MPARKKDPSTRARRNKASTSATLVRAVPDDTTSSEALSAMTVAQLRAAIKLRNESRPEDAQLPATGGKAALVAALAAADSPDVPALPKHPTRYYETADGERVAEDVEWHDQTRAWWADVWASPMADEWDRSDVHNVMVVALLYNDIWDAETPKERKDAMAEYRLQRADLGLSPYARRRLEWTIETAEEAKDRGTKRRAASTPKAPADKGKRPDPRAGLASVN